MFSLSSTFSTEKKETSFVSRTIRESSNRDIVNHFNGAIFVLEQGGYRHFLERMV